MKVIISRHIALRNSGLLALVIFTLVSAGFSQTTGTNLASQAALVTELNVNGLKVLIKRRPNSQTVFAGLYIRGGARSLTGQTAGIESFALSEATEGSVKFPRAVLRRELARMGSVIGSGSNYDYSVISLASTRQSFDRSWDIFTDIVLNPAFAPADVELNKSKIISALRENEDEPDGYLHSLIDKTIFANTPYQNAPEGTIETIGSLKPTDLIAYHKQRMQTSRLLLVIVGDLDTDVLKKRIVAAFGKLPRGDYKEYPMPQLDFSKPTLDVTTRSLPTNYIEGVFNAPSSNNPDFYAMRVATSLLRDRVFEEVRVKRNLSYAPDAGMTNFAANTGYIYVTAVDANQAVAVMLNEIKSLKTNPVDEKDISAAAAQFLTTYYIGQETNAAQARNLAEYELIGGGWQNSFEFLDYVRQVKPAEIQAVANKYMKNLRFVVVGNPANVNRSIFLQN